MATNYIAPTWRMPENSNNTPVDKLSNYSLSFDGTNSQIDFDNNIFSGLTNFSFAGFYNNENTSSDGALFGSYATGINQILFYYDAPNGWRLLFNNGSLRVINTGFTTTMNEWHFIAASFNNTTGELIVYYDDDTFTTTVTTGTITSSTFNWSIGADGGSATKNFEGKLSLFSFYDYTLSPTQIAYLKNINDPLSISGNKPLVYYALGDNSNPYSTAGYPNLSFGTNTPYSKYSINLDNASGDYFEVPNPGQSTFAYGETEFTFSGFINPNSFINQGGVFARYKDGNNRVYLKGEFNSPYDGLMFQVTNAGVNFWIRWNGVLTLNTWQHVAFVYDGSSFKLYVNSVDQGAGTTNGGVLPSSMPDFTGFPIEIGKDSFNVSRLYDGKFSNFAIIDTALSQAQVTDLYNNNITQDLSTSALYSSVLSWWPMDENHMYFNGSSIVARDEKNEKDGNGGNLVQENIQGSAPGSTTNGIGSNITISSLKGNMSNSEHNSYSLNMADYGDTNDQGVIPANSGRTTLVPLLDLSFNILAENSDQLITEAPLGSEDNMVTELAP